MTIIYMVLFCKVLEDEKHDWESKAEKVDKILRVIVAINLQGKDQACTRSYYFNLDWKEMR